MATLAVGPGEYRQFSHYVSNGTLQAWKSAVLDNRKDWSVRGAGISYGNAWYKFIEDGLLHVYHAEAAKEMEKMRMVPRLLDVLYGLSTILVAPPGYNGTYPCVPRSADLGPYWSPCGFSVVQKRIAAESEDGSLLCHADYEGLAPYPSKLFDPKTRAYSAVISVSQPISGGGLRIFPKRYLAHELTGPNLSTGAGNDKAYIKLMAGKIVPSLDLEYAEGTLTLFDSFMFHGILPMNATKAQPRIVALAHYLFIEKPEPHWQMWY